MIEKKSIAVMTAGAGAGIAQTFILREYVDKVHGLIPGLEGLKGFGTYSAMAGMISGGVTTALGLVSILTGKITKNETIQLGLIGYGIPSLSGAILSGVFPHPDVLITGLKAPQKNTGRITLKTAGPVQGANRGVSQASGIPLRT